MTPKLAKVFAAALVSIGDFEKLFAVAALHAGATIRRRLTNAVSAMAPMLSNTAAYGQSPQFLLRDSVARAEHRGWSRGGCGIRVRD
jgi:hypothetical protein